MGMTGCCSIREAAASNGAAASVNCRGWPLSASSRREWSDRRMLRIAPLPTLPARESTGEVGRKADIPDLIGMKAVINGLGPATPDTARIAAKSLAARRAEEY